MLGLLVLGLLLITAFVMNNLAPNPVGAAKRYCIERGLNERALSLLDYHSSAKLGGAKATVQFSLNDTNQNQTVRIELKKALFQTKWKIIDFRFSKDKGVITGD